MFYNINRTFVAMAGIYLHIPFCKTRCIYCDFFSSVSMKSKLNYVDALCKELELQRDYLQGQTVETIYFGGGTPSQLSREDFERIFQTLFACFPVADDREITIEVNPDDLTPEYLHDLRELPFNRVSTGIQSFQDKDLRFLNRRHDAAQAIAAVGRIREAGFDNISIDLMYGLPGQTLEEWRENLSIALSLEVQHVSSYHLIYEKGTKLFRLLQQGKVRESDEELSNEFFSEMIERLTGAGFIHYEISNFGQAGCFSRHNSSYWTGAHYLGIGASSHSYNGSRRQWNVSAMHPYINGIAQGKIPAEMEEIDPRTAYNDYIITGLRTIWGISLDKIEQEFGRSRREYCLQQAQRHLRNGTLLQEGALLKVSKKGIFLSDGIMSDLLFAP